MSVPVHVQHRLPLVAILAFPLAGFLGGCGPKSDGPPVPPVVPPVVPPGPTPSTALHITGGEGTYTLASTDAEDWFHGQLADPSDTLDVTLQDTASSVVAFFYTPQVVAQGGNEFFTVTSGAGKVTVPPPNVEYYIRVMRQQQTTTPVSYTLEVVGVGSALTQHAPK